MTRAPPSPIFCATPAGDRLERYVRSILFFYPRLGWVPLLTCGAQPNSQPIRGYQNGPLSVQGAPYAADLQGNRVSILEPSRPRSRDLTTRPPQPPLFGLGEI
ncbi:hypothetical protein AVEN_139420-1 [Araneus ventricosus]|uniref:Uncharacterized protein n=1 Tax=Araneus ventricosus TaxID=182803 RepID=A0A4Y2W2J5_ARAVE|nr:hypothetical protein AVEN_139420-1 [Araneus ventricosus]